MERPGRGLTPLELARGDERMVDLLTNYGCIQEDVRTTFDIWLTGVLKDCG